MSELSPDAKDVFAHLATSLLSLARTRYVAGCRDWTGISAICPVESEEGADAFRDELRTPGGYATSRRVLGDVLRGISPGLIRSDEELRLTFHTLVVNDTPYVLCVLQREPSTVLDLAGEL